MRLEGKVALITGATKGGCVYLASDESRYVTGSILPIDGGYLACPS